MHYWWPTPIDRPLSVVTSSGKFSMASMGQSRRAMDGRWMVVIQLESVQIDFTCYSAASIRSSGKQNDKQPGNKQTATVCCLIKWSRFQQYCQKSLPENDTGKNTRRFFTLKSIQIEWTILCVFSALMQPHRLTTGINLSEISCTN